MGQSYLRRREKAPFFTLTTPPFRIIKSEQCFSAFVWPGHWCCFPPLALITGHLSLLWLLTYSVFPVGLLGTPLVKCCYWKMQEFSKSEITCTDTKLLKWVPPSLFWCVLSCCVSLTGSERWIESFHVILGHRVEILCLRELSSYSLSGFVCFSRCFLRKPPPPSCFLKDEETLSELQTFWG